MSETIFALDIGTRNVVGIVAEKEERHLNILASCRMEHETRTMYDGQIHDIEGVARIVKVIKEKLETTTKKKLKKAAVAVAGRALKTVRAKVNRNISLANEISKEEVLNLELVAVDEVLVKLTDEKAKKTHTDFYCVDYSVVYYELDKSRITSLVGHRGTNIGVEVLATFLPHVVLNSMYTAIRKAGLEPMSLTLEPIAAISVIVPPDMRNLNLVLIDTGAGTSDIAITNKGTVIAYGMIPMAGDSVTERFCKRHVMHFSVAERVKKSLAKGGNIEFENTLRKRYKIPAEKLLEEVTPQIEGIVKKITKEILRLNSGPPEGVIAVGGSSQLPLFKEMLARELGINEDRVVTGDPGMIRYIKGEPSVLDGPQSVTPLGIAYTAGRTRGLQFLSVKVNKNPIQLMNVGGELNIFKALVVAGIDTKNLHGKKGNDLSYTLNDEEKAIKGTTGSPAQIKVNGRKANLETKINMGDEIEITQAKDGIDAEAKIRDIVGGMGRKKVTINGIKTGLSPIILMNGHHSHYDTKVTHGGKIEVVEDCDLKEALTQAGFEVTQAKKEKISITINEKKEALTQANYKVTINGKEADLDANIKEGDEIEYKTGEDIQYRIRDVVKLPKDGEDIKVIVNDRTFIIKGAKGRIYMNDKEVHPDEIITNGAEITTTDGRQAKPHLSQIFKYLPRSSISTKGKALKILVNGKKAGFITNLKDGDVVKVYFE